MLGRSLFDTKAVSVRIMFIIAMLGSILSFVPFYMGHIPLIVEDPEDGVRNSYEYRVSAVGTLILIVPTSMDIILDLIFIFLNHIAAKYSITLKKPTIPIIIVRLTVIERSLFVLGVAMQCVVALTPSDARNLLILYRCANNCSTVLTISPILMFLQRCTVTYSSMVTVSVALSTALGAAINSMSYCYNPNSDESRRTFFIGGAFYKIAAIIYILVCVLCISIYLNQKSRETLHKRSGLHPQGGLKKEIKVVDEMYENYIPAAHIFSGIMFVILNATWSEFKEDSGIDAMRINYILIGIATWVLVVEFRIRKNEVERGLVSSALFLFMFFIFCFLALLFFMFEFSFFLYLVSMSFAIYAE